MTWLSLPPFLLASLIIELTPGPNMAFLAYISASKGRRHGFATTAGVALGLLIIGLLAALGVTRLVSASPFLFQLLRWGGIFYIVYLAWEGWRSSGENSPSRHKDNETMATYFRHGLVINLLNPKAGLFFVAVLPTFLSPQPGAWEAPLLTLIYVAIATFIHVAIVTFCALLHPVLSDPDRNALFRKALSIALFGVALWMFWTTR